MKKENSTRCRRQISKTIILLSLISGMALHSPAQKPDRAKIDSLRNALNTRKSDTAKVNALNALADEFKNNEPDSALYYGSKAEELARKLDYKMGIAGALLNLATALTNQGDYDGALKHINEALKINDQLLSIPAAANEKAGSRSKAWQQKSRAYNILGTIYKIEGNYPQALLKYFASLKISEETGDKPGIVFSYGNIGNVYYAQGNYPQALKSYFASLKLSEELGNKSWKAVNLGNIGMVYEIQGNVPEALKNYFNSLKIRQETGDKQGLAASYNNIGNVYLDQANYPEALKNYFASLRVNEELENKYGKAVNLGNIGLIYAGQGNYPEALKNDFAALKICEELGDKAGIASSYNNIGNVYYKKSNYPDALKNYSASLKIFEETGDKSGAASAYQNIGNIYDDEGNHAEALKNYFTSLKIRQEIGDKRGTADSYINLGDCFMNQRRNMEASRYFNKGLSIAKEIGALDQIQECYKGLSILDSIQGKYERSLAYYKLYISARDSIFNKENTRMLMRSQMQYEFDKIRLTDSLSNEKEKLERSLSYKESLHKKDIQRDIFIFTCSAILVLAGGLWSRLRYIKRNTAIIQKERQRSEDLLLNILPYEVAEELKQTGHCLAKTYSMVTVMFTDFSDFTSVSEKVSAELLVDEINFCFSAFDKIIQEHHVEKIKTLGDSYICACGLPVLNYTHAFDLVSAALEIRDFMLRRKLEKEARGEIPFRMRIGIHTGPVVAGIVGVKKFQYDIWGDTVNLAARMESSGEEGQVNISGATFELVKDNFNCTYRGKITAKHKGEVDMYFVDSISQY